MLTCPTGFEFSTAPRTWIHDSQVHLLASDLSTATHLPTVDPSGLTHRSRPEIKIIGVQGGTDYIDFTVVHLLSSESRVFKINQQTLRDS